MFWSSCKYGFYYGLYLRCQRRKSGTASLQKEIVKKSNFNKIKIMQRYRFNHNHIFLHFIVLIKDNSRFGELMKLVALYESIFKIIEYTI